MERTSMGYVLLAMVGVLSCGCTDHPPLYPVTGKVMFSDGTPLTVGGGVMFQSINTQDAKITLDATGLINEDGTFEMSTGDLGPGVAAGEYRALVRAARDIEKNPMYPPPSIDPRFNRFQTSGLKFTVTEGENDFTIVVEPPTGQSRLPPHHR